VRKADSQTENGVPAAIHTAKGGAVYVAPEGVPEGAGIFFFTRLGGVSDSPYDSLNVSRKVGDAPAAVDENLSLIREAMAGRPAAWVRQVAGDNVVRVCGPGLAGEADALVTAEPDLCLTVAIADCVPVVLVGEYEVGMVHSGWRGTLARVSGRTARSLRGPNLRAYIGPSIRRCCYEVSPGLAARFRAEFGEEVVSGRYLSLQDAISSDLESAGVQVDDLGLCSGCRPDLFYSHRKQGPLTGRNLASVVREAG
jgi:purine-nucleoside/S-methyl-5'-thioadenosine phosphorylase / adenosine deaminase